MTRNQAREIFASALRSFAFRNLSRQSFHDGDCGVVVEWSVDVLDPCSGEVVGSAVMPEHYEEVEVTWL